MIEALLWSGSPKPFGAEIDYISAEVIYYPESLAKIEYLSAEVLYFPDPAVNLDYISAEVIYF